MIFNAQSGDSSSRVKKSDDVADDVTGWSDAAKKPAVNDGEETSAATATDAETEPQTTVSDKTSDKDLHQQRGISCKYYTIVGSYTVIICCYCSALT